MKLLFISLLFFSLNGIAGIQPYNPEKDNVENEEIDYVTPGEIFDNIFNSIDDSVKSFDDSLKEDWESNEDEKNKGPSNPYAY